MPIPLDASSYLAQLYVCNNPLSTSNEDVDSVLGIRIACTSTNRNHNSVLMYDNLVIDFLKVALSQHNIWHQLFKMC